MKYASQTLTDKIQRIQLLQSNVNRVYNQHQTLKHLLNETEAFKKISECVQAIHQVHERSNELRQKVQKLKAQKDSKQNGLKKQDQTKIKQLNFEIYNTKQQLKQIKALQINNKKHHQQTANQHNNQLKHTINQQLNQLNRNVGQYLNNIYHKFNNTQAQQILFHSKAYIDEKYQKQQGNIQAQIGWLICQLEYVESEQCKNKINSKIREVPLQNEEEIGKFQRQLIVEELGSFLAQNTNRLLYELEIVSHKVASLSNCFKLQESRNQRNQVVMMDYGRQLQTIQSSFQKLMQEYEGMKERKMIERERIKELDKKLMELSSDTTLQHLKFENDIVGLKKKFEEGEREILEVKLQLRHHIQY